VPPSTCRSHSPPPARGRARWNRRGALAWLQIKQYSSLAESYSVAAHELSLIESLLDASYTEDSWAHFVNEAENAISREHTTWRARRS
jgi:SMODS and SLOG-associating 2TM effector domain 1